MESSNPRSRYVARVEELAALVKDDRRPPEAGALLEVAGDLLRRAGELKVDERAVEAALRLLAQPAVESFLSTLALDEISARMTRAADEAVEAALPEGAEEAETWRAWALEGILSRDRLESILAAVRRLGQAWASPLADALAARLKAEDRALRGKARWFTGLNALRRQHRELLDPSGRAGAWWFSSRADCDGLISWLGGVPADAAHLGTCKDCQGDLAVARDVEQPRTRHLSADDLWKLDLGLTSRAERAAVDAHAADCVECRRAVAALAEGERAIAEAAGGPGRTEQPRQQPSLRPPDRPEQGGPELLEDGKELRVLLFRQKNRARLVVVPTPGRRIAAAAVLLPEQSRTPLRPRSTEEGLEFELPEGRSLQGSRITLKLQWTDGQEPYEQDWTLS